MVLPPTVSRRKTPLSQTGSAEATTPCDARGTWTGAGYPRIFSILGRNFLDPRTEACISNSTHAYAANRIAGRL